MTKYNKIVVASSMFMEAHHRYLSAKHDIDYIVSIVLAGSVVGIVSPLLKEQGGQTSHQMLAEIGNLLVDSKDADMHEGLFREIYNSFKHSGNKRKGLDPSEDMEIETDLKLEAAHMLDAAKDDFLDINISSAIRNDIPGEFITLLESLDYYAE
ncbi:MAG: hypothetical protein KAS48_09060 [Gammaproteobacteria bacterium]|nr:hypothetical protein [Gammaproteobacteria bacterium]